MKLTHIFGISVLLLTGWWTLATAAETAPSAEEDDDDAAYPVDIIMEEERDVYAFDDQPLGRIVKHPAWFQTGGNDLRASLRAALKTNKIGLILYFGQKNCSYCEELLNNTVARSDIASYVQKHFEVIALDVQSRNPLVDFEGKIITQKDLATREGTNLTPALLFYNASGQQVLRLRGYYPPYIFRAALDYVVGGDYQQQTFPQHLQRGRPRVLEQGDASLNRHPLFRHPPYQLNRLPSQNHKLLAVFFEQSNCHACDVMHRELLNSPEILRSLQRMNLVRFDMYGDTPLTTPSGERTTAEEWARELGIFYAPTLVFFDQGKEVFRVDSVVRMYRLKVVMDYLLSKGYQEYSDNLQGWFFGNRNLLPY